MRDRPFRSPDPGPPGPRKCRACGLSIEFMYDETGEIIAVQKVEAVYIVGRDSRTRRVLIRQDSLAGESIRIPHSGNCPKEGKVSKNKRQKPHA